MAAAPYGIHRDARAVLAARINSGADIGCLLARWTCRTAIPFHPELYRPGNETIRPKAPELKWRTASIERRQAIGGAKEDDDRHRVRRLAITFCAPSTGVIAAILSESSHASR